MQKKTLRTLAALLIGTAALAVQAQSTMTPQQQQAHDRAKEVGRTQTQSGGLLNGIVGDRGRAHVPASAQNPPPGTGSVAGTGEALILTCWNEVVYGPAIGQQLSDNCEPALRGTSVSSNHTTDFSQLVEDLCVAAVRLNRAPNTRLHHHCMNLLSAKQMALNSLAGRDASINATQRQVTVDNRSQPNMTQDQIRNSYSACTTESRQVAPATMEERICETSRASSQGNSCSKTLTARVAWQCPAGAISGPTRVVAGTLLRAGQYTCEVQVPRNVYTCPGDSIGPTNLVVPPGTQPQPACRRSDNTVVAATLTVVQDIETRDATHTVTDDWTDGCATLESQTPPPLRNPPFGSTVGPMAPFDSSPETQRCRLAASTCLDPSSTARLINDVPVTRACWQYRESFDCLTTTVVEQCEPDPACTLSSDTCLEWDNHSNPPTCIRHELRQNCQIAPPVMRDQTSCDNQTYCPGGTCWDTGYRANNEFGEVMSLFAAGQQGARYFNANDFQIFKGYPAVCAHRLGLVLNCCRENLFGDLLFDALHAAENLRPPNFFGGGGEDTSQLFNDKTYDMLFAADSSGQLAAGLRAVSTMKGEATGLWNDIKDQDWKKVATRLLLTAPMAIGNAMVNATIDGVVQQVTFYGLIDGCSDEDKTTRQKRRKHLCVDVGSRCHREVPVVGWCWERHYASCCFNSLLAKLINDQGRRQILEAQMAGRLSPPDAARSLFSAGENNINRRFGTGERPNCLGFSLDQMRLIDFSQLDLTPFLATLDPQLPNLAQLRTRLESMHRNCPAGVGQCDGNTPESLALDTNGNLGANDREGNAVPRQLLSLKPLMRQAYPLAYGQSAGPAAINSDDWRQLRNYRFAEGEPPVTATVTPLREHPTRPNCKVMQVDITRARVTRDWQDRQVPVRDAHGTVTAWRPAAPGEVPRSNVADRNQNGGIPEEGTTGWRGGTAIPETTTRSTINYCADGTVPGVTGP
jgi:hypothetical protein